MNESMRQRETLSDLATVYGCCGLFDICSDQDLISLTMQGSDPFLDWIGWQGTDICVIKKNFITFMRPEQSGGTCTGGYVSDPCAEPHTVEFGTCDFTLEDFGRLRRRGPVRDVTMNDVRYCERQPRYRLDGSMITDSREFDAIVTAEVILQDLRNMIVTGNAATGGQFDGLQQLVATGYVNSSGRACSSMDSFVIDWNQNPMAGGAGITVNGAAIAATWNLVDVLLAVFRRIRQRIMLSPTLASRVGGGLDIALVLPTHLIDCLLDHYTCWSVCDGAQYNEVALQSYEARQFRNSLLGGKFGFGQIKLDNTPIPLLAYDWGLINGPTCGDMYLLVNAVGNVKLINGQYLNMNTVPDAYPGSFYRVSDGGRFLHWTVQDETCVTERLEIRPRLLMWAPWAQARFEDVCCQSVLDPLSPDPCETSFFPETSFSVAACA